MMPNTEKRMIEVKLTKCVLYLTEAELINLLAKDPAIWQQAIQRGKAFKRHEQFERRPEVHNGDIIPTVLQEAENKRTRKA